MYYVKGWYPFEFVIRIIEEGCNLTRGCYKLSYKHASLGDVWIENDRNWHEAVNYFMSHAYIMPLDLKKIPDAGAGTDMGADAGQDAGPGADAVADAGDWIFI